MTDLIVCLLPLGVKNCLAETSFHLPTTDDCTLTTMKLEKLTVMQIICEAFNIKAITLI